jgi:hypothetical protein
MMAAVLALIAFAPGTASAQLIDPNMAISGTGAFGTHPVQLGSNVTSVTVTPKGSDQPFVDATHPWFLILGIPNPAGSTFPTITQVNGTNLVTPISGSDSGKAVKSGSDDAYTLLGLTGNNSENFTNWSGHTTGISSWELIVYSITTPMSTGIDAATSITFSSALPASTYVIAQGTNGNKQFSTPFTTAGLTGGQNTITPEPSTLALALLGAAGFGVAGLRRRRRQKAPA